MNAAPIIPNNLFVQEVYQLNDIGSERGALACLMTQPRLIFEAERLLPPEAFGVDMNQYVYKIMLYMAGESNANGWPLYFDAMSMLSSAKRLGVSFEQSFIAKTDGMEQIRSIELLKTSGMVQAEQFPMYVHTLLDRHKRRAMYEEARRVQQAVLNFQAHPLATELAVKVEQRYGSMAFDGMEGSERQLKRLGDYREEAMVKTRLVRQGNHLFHVPCPLLPQLSTMMGGGYPRKGLIMVCARPKVGKSTLLLASAIEQALGRPAFDAAGNIVINPQTGLGQWQYAPIPVLYLDTEMSGEEMFFRGLSNMSLIAEGRILGGKFHEDGNQVAAIETQLNRIANAPLFYVNVAGQSAEFVKSIMRQFRNQIVGTQQVQDPLTGKWYTFSNPACVYYDWMRLPDGDGLKHAQETQLLGFLASTIKQSAYELDMPVVAGAQLNREAVGAAPEDWEWNAEAFISGSDRLAMYCSQMCVLRNLLPVEIDAMPAEWQTYRKYRTDLQSFKFNQRLHMILNRNGTEARYGIPLYIDKGYARYEEVIDNETMAWVKNRASTRPVASVKNRKGDVPQPKEAVDAANQQAVKGTLV
jgi:replicative DNA helicase